MHPDLVDAITSARISPDALLKHFDQGQIEHSKNQYQASSDHFTAAIDDATNSLSTLLLSRALAYTNDGEHDRALSDAHKVIEITPASADGYLCAGDVYVVKAKMEEALRIYRNGVANANKDHPRYHSLANTLDHVYNNVILPTNAHLLERLGKRIANHVFSFLPLRDRVVCAATCHTWRTYLFSWEGMWHHLRFTSGISTQCLDTLFARIEKGDQVKTCTVIAKWNDFDLAPQVLERLVLRLKCRNLEALSVGNCNVKTTQWMIRLLRMNIKTMKSLALINVAQQLYPLIHQVLDLCPGITNLVFDLHELWDGESKSRDIDYNAEKVIPPSSKWRPRTPLALQQLKLTSKVLNHNKEGVYTFGHFLSTFLPHCPELCNLVVRGDTRRCLDGVIDALNAYCPKLRGLVLDDYSISDDRNIYDFAFGGPFAPPRLSIRTILLEKGNHCDDFDQKLAALAMRIAPHVQVLDSDISSLSQLALKALGEIKTPKLEDLTLSATFQPSKELMDHAHTNEITRTIIQGCSLARLKKVALHNLSIDDSVFDSLPAGLTTLDLYIKDHHVTSQGLRRCISRMHGLKKLHVDYHHHLQKKYAGTSIVDGELLHEIAQLPSIVELILAFSPDGDVQPMFSKFAKELRYNHPQLPMRSLRLGGPILTTSILENLVCLPNLGYLNVRMAEGIAADQIKEILHKNRVNDDQQRPLNVVASIRVGKRRDVVTFKNGEIVTETQMTREVLYK